MNSFPVGGIDFHEWQSTNLDSSIFYNFYELDLNSYYFNSFLFNGDTLNLSYFQGFPSRIDLYSEVDLVYVQSIGLVSARYFMFTPLHIDLIEFNEKPINLNKPNSNCFLVELNSNCLNEDIQRLR